MTTHQEWVTRSGESYKSAAHRGELEPGQPDLSDVSTKSSGRQPGSPYAVPLQSRQSKELGGASLKLREEPRALPSSLAHTKLKKMCSGDGRREQTGELTSQG